MEDLQQNTVFDDLVEKAQRATNQIKTYLYYDDYDGLITYLVDYLSGILRSHKRIHYKILKMKFIDLLTKGSAGQAKDLFFKQILPFFQETFNSPKLSQVQIFFLSSLNDSNLGLLKNLLQTEKDYLVIKIFRSILLFITEYHIKSNSLPDSLKRDAYTHLEIRKQKYESQILLDPCISDIEENEMDYCLPQLQNTADLNLTGVNQTFTAGKFDSKSSGNSAEYFKSENNPASTNNPQNFSQIKSKNHEIPKFIVKNKDLSNYLNDKSSIVNSMTKNNFNVPRNKKVEDQTNYSGNSTCKYSSFSEFNKNFKPGFDKKENVDKKILRKLRSFLIESNKKKTIDLSQTDKKFWIMFINDNFLPPLKYNNPDVGESVEFKSFSNNYLMWLFSKQGSYYLYEKFIEECGTSLYEKFIESSTKLAESNLPRQQLLFYLKNFHKIYSRDNNVTPQYIEDEFTVNYLVHKDNFGSSEETLKDYIGNEQMADSVPCNMQIDDFRETTNEELSYTQTTGPGQTEFTKYDNQEYAVIGDDVYLEDNINSNANTIFNNIEMSYNQMRKYESRNSLDSNHFNIRRERSRNQSRDYEIWVYHEDLYPIFNPNSEHNSNWEFGYKDQESSKQIEPSYNNQFTDDATGRKNE